MSGLLATLCLTLPVIALAEVGDPQIRTDHPWYPGELAISSFPRLFETQAEIYRRVTGRAVESDEDKALASWLWRNTHYWHGEAGARDLWGEGVGQGRDRRLHEYWNGLFGYGFGLCGTTHSQWTAEFESLLGHARSRGVGAAGHNAFEAFLRDDAYGAEGRWVLLDHDLSTVVFSADGRRLLGLGEMQSEVERWTDRNFKPQRQRGWLVCGLHPSDGASYRRYDVAEYLAGYAGPPPIVGLRRGETMRRYFRPGLADGKTFVFWGRNYGTDGIPGPERSRTWVNQPELMFGSKSGTAHRNGQARFANVEYVYRPDFRSRDYREGVVQESNREVVLEFQTPYVIAATPAHSGPWGIYEPGCRNGLVVQGKARCQVSVSVDDGRSWSEPLWLNSRIDLTDQVKGRGRYWLKFDLPATRLTDAELQIRTVCQANVAVLPRLKDSGTTIHYAASGKSVTSLGPEANLAQTYLSDGGFDSPELTLQVVPRRPVVGIYAAGHVQSGSPPVASHRFHIECSAATSARWQPIVSDWVVERRGDEPADFWSQSFCYGSADVTAAAKQPLRIRFRSDAGKRWLRAETHLIHRTTEIDPLRVTYHWTDSSGTQTASHTFDGQGSWQLNTQRGVSTHWVEFEPVPRSVR